MHSRIEGLYRSFDKHFLYPAYYWKSGDPRLSHLTVLEKNQSLPAQQLAALQLHRLKRMVHYAFAHVPFYRRLYTEAGVSPFDLKTLDDLSLFPLISKQDLQQHADEMISSEYRKSDLLKDASGGSTGAPTNYYKNREHRQLRAADQVRHDRWSGWDIGQPYGLIWGASRDLQGISSLKQELVTKYIHRCYPLDAFEMSPPKMREYAAQLKQVKPAMLLGYANALYQFALYLSEHDPNHGISPKGIISSAETLQDDKKKLIESVFDCKVLNRYGSREVGLIASECHRQEGLHINADNVLVEVIESAETGKPVVDQSGEIVVTDFWNFGMPFIRYRMGDIGKISSHVCSCGRSLPLLSRVEGRVSDFFTAIDGTRVHGEYFTHLFYGDAEIEQFQLVQESRELLTLKLVTSRELLREKTDYYSDEIKKILGQSVSVEIQKLDKIEPTASGKFLFTISKV